jgi:ligand-binding sensor domain-containing protein
MGTSKKEVWRYDAASWTQYDSLTSGFKGFSVECIAHESNGTVWFGGSTWGVSWYDGATWGPVMNNNNSGMPYRDCLATAIDKNDTKWFGTATLARLISTDSWRSWKPSPTSPLLGTLVNGIAVDSSNNKWMCSYGLTKYQDDGGIWTNFSYDSTPLPSPNLTCITVSPDQSVWIGSSDQGVIHYTPDISHISPKNKKHSVASLLNVSKIFSTHCKIITGIHDSRITIMDMQGKLVKHIAIPYNLRTVFWDGTDMHGWQVSNGQYLVVTESRTSSRVVARTTRMR